MDMFETRAVTQADEQVDPGAKRKCTEWVEAGSGETRFGRLFLSPAVNR